MGWMEGASGDRQVAWVVPDSARPASVPRLSLSEPICLV